jgi:endoglucanase
MLCILAHGKCVVFASNPNPSTFPLTMNTDLLKRLCETPGVPGREERVRALIEKEIDGLFDEVRTDAMGSLICTRHPRGKAAGGKKKGSQARPTRVMQLCHMDEIGFYVTHIDDKGYLWLNSAGGFDTRNLFSRRVLVVTDSGDHKAVMNPAGRPIHISGPKDREKIPEVKEFFVDMGLPGDKVKKKVKVGDYVVMDEPLIEVGDKLVSKAMDNRVACWLGIESVRQLDKNKNGHACEVVVAFTVQEEVGLRGAKTASHAVEPDIGLGIDVTLACDTPGVPPEEAVSRHGQGFALHIKDSSFISDHQLVNEIEKLAIKNKIPYQRSILAAGGQDGAAAQQAAAGARAVGITVGTRYIHTVTEMVDRKDLAAARDILAVYIASVA